MKLILIDLTSVSLSEICDKAMLADRIGGLILKHRIYSFLGGAPSLDLILLQRAGE